MHLIQDNSFIDKTYFHLILNYISNNIENTKLNFRQVFHYLYFKNGILDGTFKS